MIKIVFRKNLIYLLLLIISYFTRRIIAIILNGFGLINSLIFSFLMCLGQIVGGSLIYWYQNSFLNKKEKIQEKKYLYELITTERELTMADNMHKIRLLIFFAAFFDLEEYIIISFFIPKLVNLSATITIRLCCIMTITSSIICTHTLKSRIGKHQIFSLIILGLISCIIIILEFIYTTKDVNIGKYIISYSCVVFHFIFLSFTDVIEKYLVDYNYINPFQILMSEGIINFLLSSIYSIFYNPFDKISHIYQEKETGKFTLLIFLMLLYSVLSAFVNIYKLLCNVLYSPMTKSLASYFLSSPFIIYHYVMGNDFINDGEKNTFYFIISLVFSVLIDIFGLIYNEFFILKCFGLSKETYDGISIRARESQTELNDFKNSDNNNITDND